MIYGFTGHRPPKLGGYGKEVQQKLYSFAHHTLRQNLKLYDPSVGYTGDSAIIGMAQGWDIAVAQACCVLDVSYIAAVPYPGQELAWPDQETRNLYGELLYNAEQVVYISESTGGNAAWALQLRNQWIVDHSNKLIALWDGEKSGGTWNCVKYADSKKKGVINVWPEWEKFQ